MQGLYGGDESAPTETPQSEKDSESIDELEQSSETTTVPTSLLAGPDGQSPKEGDEVVVKVVKCAGDQCVIAYAPKETEPQSPNKYSDDMDGGKELESMATGV